MPGGTHWDTSHTPRWTVIGQVPLTGPMERAAKWLSPESLPPPPPMLTATDENSRTEQVYN